MNISFMEKWTNSYNISSKVSLCTWHIWVYRVYNLFITVPQWVKSSSLARIHDHTQRRITVGRNPLDEWSARRRDLYLTIGILWTSDQPDAETSTWQHTTLTTDRHPCLRRDSNPQSQKASGRRPTP